MILIILAIVLFLVLFFINEPDWGICYHYKNPFAKFLRAMRDHWYWLISGTLLTGVLSTLVIAIISIVASSVITPIEVRDSINPIYALEDSTSTYVWRYSHDNDIFLSYVTEDEKGLIIKNIKARKVHINYTDGQPTVEKYYSFFKLDFMNYIIFPLYEPSYILNVPFDSISAGYNIDLKGD